MLPKINRIKKKNDFEEIFKKGRGFKGGLLIFKIIKNNLGFNRFGFVVSQKVSKKAVIRNKARRRMSEVIRENAENIKKGFDMVLVALPGIEKKDYKEIKQEIETLLNKNKLINKN